MSEFSRLALDDGEGTHLTREQRLRLALVGELPPLALTSAMAGKVTRERIRYAFAELAAMNVDNVHRWLGEVASQSPAKAIELFMELATYSIPKLKAVAIDVRSSDGSVKTLSYADLEQRVLEHSGD